MRAARSGSRLRIDPKFVTHDLIDNSGDQGCPCMFVFRPIKSSISVDVDRKSKDSKHQVASVLTTFFENKRKGQAVTNFFRKGIAAYFARTIKLQSLIISKRDFELRGHDDAR